MNGSDVNDLLIFMSVVETGSFVAGGRLLGLSRSAAGKAVARLETRYATRLLNRSTRAIATTQEGRILYEHGQAIRTAMDVAEGSIGSGSGQPRGMLRITVPDAFGRRVILPLVARYLSEWPKVQVELSLSDRVANVLDEGFDLAIRINVTSPDRGLIARTIVKETPVLCAAPAYLDRRGEPTTAEQLGSHELLFFTDRKSRQNWHLQEQDGTWRRVLGRSRLRLDSAEAIRDACLAGLGIAILPRFLVGEDIAAGCLRQLLPNVSAGTVNIVALYPHRKLLEPRVRHFIDLLVKALSARAPMLDAN